METKTTGRVLTEATIARPRDHYDARQGHFPPEQVRRVTVPDALVDAGATTLSLPTQIIRRLGLEERYKKRVWSSAGVPEADVFDAARPTIRGRICTTHVMEVSDDPPAFIGQIPWSRSITSRDRGRAIQTGMRSTVSTGIDFGSGSGRISKIL